jgi:hypothetical protein
MSINELLGLFRCLLVEHIDSGLAMDDIAVYYGYDFNDLLKRVQRLANGGHPIAIELLEVFNE